GSPLKSALAPAQDQAAFPLEMPKIHQRGRVAPSIVRDAGRKLSRNTSERRDARSGHNVAGPNSFPVVAVRFVLAIHAAHTIDVQCLHVQAVGLTEPFGIV